jgi:ubiquitin-protein ligase
VADFGILARVCRPLLQLTKGQQFLQSLYERGLYFTEPFSQLDRILRRKMGSLIQDSVLNTASGAPLWGNLCRTDNMCHWKGFLTAPETSPFASADVVVNIHFGSQFPFTPFKVYFDSRVFHPNVNVHGKLCVPFLGVEWCPACCLSLLLWNIITVLGMPHVPEEYDNDNEAMKLYIECPKLYHKRAEELYNEKKSGEYSAGGSNTQQKP